MLVERRLSSMLGARTGILLAAAIFMSGILAGTIVDRALVGGPAWHALGAEAWAQFSRRADLGAGLIAYPVEAIGTTLLLIGALVSSRFDRSGRGRLMRPLLTAVVLSLLGLVVTVKAAPIMLSLRAAESPAPLQRAFEDFFLWGIYLRGTIDVLTFVAAIWALTAMCGANRSKMTES
jgi:hypothetical protein